MSLTKMFRQTAPLVMTLDDNGFHAVFGLTIGHG